ncbi:MAG: DUF1289 domain-containing protein [Burkholderiales bacterium]|nr:DUF1289 domain-containing protein [Burkholderiales bacterium]
MKANEVSRPIADIATPCVRNCCLGDDDICVGCYRSIAEILSWSDASEEEKKEILDRCHTRYKQRRGRDSLDPT